jgi:phosphatidylglycerol:prolipoprotein diacylglycerol transferase
VRPILAELPFGVPLYGYGAMLCLSVLVGLLLAGWLAERDGRDPVLTNRCAAWALAGAVLGARLLYVVTNLDQFNRADEVFRFWEGGVVAYGGFLGGFAGAVLFSRIHGLRMLEWADCVAPSLCVGLALTRIGCLLGGCDFGRPWDGPWAIQFPAGSAAYNQQVLEGLLTAGATRSLPVHPTQIYESLAGLVLLGVALTVRRRRTFTGQTFIAVVLGYAVLRSGIEVFRADLNRGAVGPFSTSQVIAVATFIAAVAFTCTQRRRGARQSQSVVQ